MTHFWEGFIDGLLISAAVLGVLGLGALAGALLYAIVGAVWSLVIIVAALAFSTGLGYFYASEAYDELDDDEDGDSYRGER
jgi:hypothetical protein